MNEVLALVGFVVGFLCGGCCVAILIKIVGGLND